MSTIDVHLVPESSTTLAAARRGSMRARCRAVAKPAGPAPTIATSYFCSFLSFQYNPTISSARAGFCDGGNSFFLDTERRNKELEAEGFNYIGTGVSGGEEGALHGPAIMPGGHETAYKQVEKKIGRRPSRDETLSYLMYPDVFLKFAKLFELQRGGAGSRAPRAPGEPEA